MSDRKLFDLTGPLPSGLTVLEASAGTGKTYALAALATRYVAEKGLTAGQLCIVSFTEAATAELRGRVRARMAEAATHLSTGGPKTDDEVLTALADVDDKERALRLGRLEKALADFDAATISTIHGFCSRVATSSVPGIESAITGDNADVAELVNDEYLSRFGGGAVPPVELKRLIQAVELRLTLPDAVMNTMSAEGVNAKQLDRVELIGEAATLVDELVAAVLDRRARTRRRTFDSLITDARDLLTGSTGAAAIAALRSRFSVVLIDEFQDTDQVQWDIFRTAFLDGDEPVDVILVGDPKQSIYRFRSAELSAYLSALDYAKAHGGSVASLDTNWRSDEPLLLALEQVFDGYAFGDPRVAFAPVKASPDHTTCAISGVDGAAVQFRSIPDTITTVPEARAHAVHDLVAEVVWLLNTATVVDHGVERPLRASDIGVLVRSNNDATLYARALGAAGVAAASSSADSVLDSAAAVQWRTLLAALERPSSQGRARAAALSWFIGQDAATLAALDEDGLGILIEQLREWALCLSDGGLPKLLASLREQGLLLRVLSRPGGERDLTDLDHLVELMQSVTGGRPASAPALLAALASLSADTPAGSIDEVIAPELLARRIDRDDDTLKVLTVHMAKGLEFPVVMCPTLWAQSAFPKGVPHAWVENERRIDTSYILNAAKTTAAAFQKIAQLDRSERAGEDGRLLYVALTRAKHRLVLWWSDAPKSAPLEDLLSHACGGASVDLVALASESHGRIDVVPVRADQTVDELVLRDGDAPELGVAVAERELDRRWRKWSFSSVKAMAELHAESAATVASSAEPPVEGGTDEPSLADGGATDDERDGSDAPEVPVHRVMPLQEAPGGTGFGTLVHSVLERVDFASADLRGELRELCAEALSYRRLDITPDSLTDGLLTAMNAPLGGPVGKLRLIDLGRSDRLDELSFDMPLAGIDAAEIAAVLLVHLPADDVLRPWAEHAAAGGLAVEVAGMLTGSIDLVARSSVAGPYWLADYKTNFLPDGTYDTADLAEAMEQHAYPLQATLYLVALHRYLRWRLPDYEPDRDLVGAAYLFLRGMDPDRPAEDPRGVIWWRPPTVAIHELDALLAIGVAP